MHLHIGKDIAVFSLEKVLVFQGTLSETIHGKIRLPFCLILFVLYAKLKLSGFQGGFRRVFRLVLVISFFRKSLEGRYEGNYSTADTG